MLSVVFASAIGLRSALKKIQRKKKKKKKRESLCQKRDREGEEENGRLKVREIQNTKRLQQREKSKVCLSERLKEKYRE